MILLLVHYKNIDLINITYSITKIFIILKEESDVIMSLCIDDYKIITIRLRATYSIAPGGH